MSLEKWKQVPFHTLFRRVGKRTGCGDKQLLSVYRNHGVIIKSDRDDNFNRPGESLDDYQLVNPGDLVLNKMKTWQGSLGVSAYEGIVSPAYFVYEPKGEFDNRYMHHLLRSQDSINYYGAHSKGIRVNQWDLQPEYLNQMKVCLPPLETQQRIADYLDRETAEIDAAVADLDRYVDQLEKRRRAVVYEALALKKGPGSGTQISDPQRGRVGFVARLLRRGISPDYVDDGMPVINQKCIRPGGFLAMDNCRFHDLDARGINSNLTIQPGDTLINSTGTGTLGRSCMVREAAVPTTWDSHVTLVRPDTDIVDPVYLGWTILSQESKLIEFSAGSTNQIELSRDTVFNLDFVNIPLILQREIAAYLDRETAEIDSLIADSTSLRDLLLKRRSVLITEVVTGRKQV